MPNMWKWQETIQTGDQVKMKKNHQVGKVREIRGKKAVVQVGLIPITLDVADLVLIRDKPRRKKIHDKR